MSIKDRFAKLINVKSIITILVISVFCYLAIIGTIGAELFVPIATMIFTFYFGTQTEKKNQENGETT